MHLETIEFIPRLQQMKRFIETCECEPTMERKHLFTSLFGLADEDVDFLLFNGMLSLDSSLDVCRATLHQMEVQGVERCIRKMLLGLRHEYPSGTKLTVELYPMDENDQFGRERLGGVSAWTNWEGDTIHLVVYPANETIHFLKSTVVHEYNHHYRIATLNNGHADVTLLEKIIREGLAEHFVGDVLGADFHGPWVDALSEDAAKALWETLYSVHATDIGEQTHALVFGGQNTDVPLWAGYSVGYYLVKWYRQLHPLVSVIDLTTKQCKEFIPNFRDA